MLAITTVVVLVSLGGWLLLVVMLGFALYEKLTGYETVTEQRRQELNLRIVKGGKE